MRTRGLGMVVLAAGLALGGSSCGGGGDGGTFVLVKLERGTVVGDIGSIELALTLGGQSATETLREDAGGPIALPTAVSLAIGSGEGALVVSASARDSGNLPLGSGSATVTVTRDKTATVTIVLMPATGPQLMLDRASHGFGDIDVGVTATAMFTVSNPGGQATETPAAAVTGTGYAVSATTCNAALAPGGSCTVTVALVPAAPGPQPGTLTVTAGLLTASATLTGNAIAAARLALSPTSNDFGSVVAGQTSAVADFTLSNTGGRASSALTVAVTDVTFTIADNTCTAPLAAGGSCLISVRFAPPTGTAPGARSGMLTVMAGSDMASATLTGIALTPGLLVLSPSSHDFGTGALGTMGTPVTFTVMNTGGAPSGLPAVALSDSVNYRIASTTCTAAIPGGGTCTVSVRLQPSVVGTRTGSLTVMASPGGTAASSLTALGTAVLTVTKPGNGAGTVTSTPAAIDCGTTCSAAMSTATVTLAASAMATSTFTGWGAPCSGTGQCVVTMDAAKSVPATFTLRQYTVTAAISPTGTGAGTVTGTGFSCPGDCSELVNHGGTVTLTANPSATSDFAGWTGACTGMASCVISNVTAAATATATFNIKRYTLTVTPAGTGTGTVSSMPAGLSCGSTCMAQFNHGTVVTLTAARAANSYFAGWTGACSGQRPTCRVTLTAAATVGATFTAGTCQTMTADTGTVGLWHLDETSGQTAADASASGFALTLGTTAAVESTDPVFAAGRFGNGLTFNAAQMQQATRTTANITMSGASTVEFWIKQTGGSALGGVGRVFGSGGFSWTIESAPDRITWGLADGANYQFVNLDLTPIGLNLGDGQWHYLAFTYDGTTTMRGYVDGVEAGSNALGQIPVPLSQGLNLGGRPSNTWITGSLDEVRISTTARSAASIFTYYGNALTCP